MLALVSDAGEQKAYTDEGAEGGGKEDRCVLKRRPGDTRGFSRDVLYVLIVRHELIQVQLMLHGWQTLAGVALFRHEFSQNVSSPAAGRNQA